MSNKNELIHFVHNGVQYVMTKEEIDAAYAYREHCFQEEDALRHLNYFVFGYDGPEFGDNPENAGPGEAEDLAAFEEDYGISYLDARELKAHFVTIYNRIFNCNIAENDLWVEAIDKVLSARKVAAELGYKCT
ncbi:MAG: hypothetical protein E7449_01095 [Ruminococcaceae bacterium]|nr:hypothetical protein [Oscillospiraceae bacterium]